MRAKRTLFFATMALLVAPACTKRVDRAVVEPTALATVDHKAPFLKVHMRDGSLYVLSAWVANESARLVTGTGTRYAADRKALPETSHSVALDSVALFETNVTRSSPSVGALAIVTALSASVTVYCAANPKSCFGSCPTFYVNDGKHHLLQAEGFSASIAPTLEARDVDALYRARPRGRQVRIEMVNEAYETHVVRYAKLLAVPRDSGRRVLQDAGGAFWSVTEPVAPLRCDGPDGDCRQIVSEFDERERTSAADSSDLAARESVDLVFVNQTRALGVPGLVIASRQSLLPTYLLYQGLAYLGTNVSQFLRALQSADSATLARTRSMAALLGGIDVQVANGTRWQTIATVSETGPLASDVRVVPLPVAGDTVRVRLRMARGAWRVDWAALTSIEKRVEPMSLEPSEVLVAGRPHVESLEQLGGGPETLVTYPGDRYTLVYTLPEDAQRYELFLDTRGYYLEWMREEWLAETNPGRAASMFLDPAGTLKRLAPEYKKVEARMDSSFWRSKYASH